MNMIFETQKLSTETGLCMAQLAGQLLGRKNHLHECYFCLTKYLCINFNVIFIDTTFFHFNLIPTLLHR